MIFEESDLSNPSNIYSVANKCSTETIDNDVEYSKCLGLTLIEKEKTLSIIH